MTDTLELLTDAIAGYRITRLITEDTITAPARHAVIAHAYRNRTRRPAGAETWDDIADGDPDPPKLATLVRCRWCMGVWVGAGIVLARRTIPRAWQPVAEAAVVAAAAALIAGLED